MPDNKPRGKEKKASTITIGTKPETSSKPATRKRQIEAGLKGKKIGSKERTEAYRLLKLKQDHTTTGYKIGGEKAKGLKKVKANTKPTAKVFSSKVTAKKTDSKRKAKLRAKGEAALKGGNTKKAQRIRKRYDNAK